MGYICL